MALTIWAITEVSLGPIVAVFVLGALSTGLANILYFRLIQGVGAATASAVDYVVPIFAVLFGAVLLREGVAWNVIVRGIIVLLGIAVAEGRLGHRKSAPPNPTDQATTSAAAAHGEP